MDEVQVEVEWWVVSPLEVGQWMEGTRLWWMVVSPLDKVQVVVEW